MQLLLSSVVWQEQGSAVTKVQRARILRVKYGIRALLEVVGGDLDHVEPADGVLVATIDGLEGAIVWANDRLGGKAAHAKEHVQDVGKALRLAVEIRGALVQGPL